MNEAAAPSRKRPEAIGFGIALLAHGALLWLLSGERDDPPPPPEQSMEVSFLEEAGPVTTAPELTEAPAPSFGEEYAAPEEAAGEPEPEPAPFPEPLPAPVPEPVRPPVQAEPRRPPQPSRNAAPPRPAQPRVAQSQPRPQPRPSPPAQRRPQAQPGQGQARRSSGFDANRLAQSLGRAPADARGSSPSPPAQLTGAQRQQIARNISNLIAPCARRAVPPNGFARSISVDLRVSVTQSGSPTGHQLVGSGGTDDTNREYVDDVVAAAMRAVRACSSRIATLPGEHYAVAGGWRTFRYRFRFP